MRTAYGTLSLSPALLISACLLGRPVRWDGSHKLIPGLTDMPAAFMPKIAFCPEMRAGFGTPRAPMRLWTDASQRLFVRRVTGNCGSASGADVDTPDAAEAEMTARLNAACRAALEEALGQGAQGVIVKSRSPSCALHDAPVFSPAGSAGCGPGFFVRQLRKLAPDMPLIDDTGLRNAQRARAFFAAVAAYQPGSFVTE